MWTVVMYGSVILAIGFALVGVISYVVYTSPLIMEDEQVGDLTQYDLAMRRATETFMRKSIRAYERQYRTSPPFSFVFSTAARMLRRTPSESLEETMLRHGAFVRAIYETTLGIAPEQSIVHLSTWRSILNVGADATAEDVKRRYRHLVKCLHPDLPENRKTGSDAKLATINAAYSIAKRELNFA